MILSCLVTSAAPSIYTVRPTTNLLDVGSDAADDGANPNLRLAQ